MNIFIKIDRINTLPVNLIGYFDIRYLEENVAVRQQNEQEAKKQEEDTSDDEDEEFTETYDYIEEIACLEQKTSSRSTPQVLEPSDDEEKIEKEEAETKEMMELDGMISVKSMDEEGSKVKKFIVSYETKVLKSPSPAPSHGNYFKFTYF